MDSSSFEEAMSESAEAEFRKQMFQVCKSIKIIFEMNAIL